MSVTMEKIESITNHKLSVAHYGVERHPTLDTGDLIWGVEKLDGANASFDLDGNVYSHHKKLDEQNTLSGFYDFVNGQNLVELFSRFFPFVNDEVQVQFFGEWLIPHPTIQYLPSAYKKWYLFDMYVTDPNGTSGWVGYNGIKQLFDDYEETLINHNVFLPKLVYTGRFSNLDELESITDSLKTDSALSIDGRMEGVVWTDLSKQNGKGSPIRVKCVNQAYKETKSKPNKVGTQRGEAEIWLSKYLTDARVQKLINKSVDEDGLVVDRTIFKSAYPKQLAEALWHDILSESPDTPSDLVLDTEQSRLQKMCQKAAARNLGIYYSMTKEVEE